MIRPICLRALSFLPALVMALLSGAVTYGLVQPGAVNAANGLTLAQSYAMLWTITGMGWLCAFALVMFAKAAAK